MYQVVQVQGSHIFADKRRYVFGVTAPHLLRFGFGHPLVLLLTASALFKVLAPASAMVTWIPARSLSLQLSRSFSSGGNGWAERFIAATGNVDSKDAFVVSANKLRYLRLAHRLVFISFGMFPYTSFAQRADEIGFDTRDRHSRQPGEVRIGAW